MSDDVFEEAKKQQEMKKVVFLLLSVLMISTVFLGCDKNLASALASKAKHITLDPDIINMKVGETIEVTAKMTDGKDKPVTVNNSKFDWSIAYGKEAIDIEPNGNTAKKTLIGNAAIKISHPEALNEIQRVVHITKGEELGEGWLHDTPEYKFFKSLTNCKWIKVDSEISQIPSDSAILKCYIFEEEKKLFLSFDERNNTNESFKKI